MQRLRLLARTARPAASRARPITPPRPTLPFSRYTSTTSINHAIQRQHHTAAAAVAGNTNPPTQTQPNLVARIRKRHEEDIRKGWSKLFEDLPKYLLFGIAGGATALAIDQLVKRRTEKLNSLNDAKQKAHKENDSNYKLLAEVDVGQTMSRLQLFTDEHHSYDVRKKHGARLLLQIIQVEILQKRANELSKFWFSGLGGQVGTFKAELKFQKDMLVIAHRINSALLSYQGGDCRKALNEIDYAMGRFHRFIKSLNFQNENTHSSKSTNIRLREVACSIFNARGLIKRGMAHQQENETLRNNCLNSSYHSYTFGLSVNPDDAYILSNRGFLLAEDMGQLKDSLTDHKQANAVKQIDPNIINGLAYVDHQSYHTLDDKSEENRKKKLTHAADAEAQYNRAIKIEDNYREKNNYPNKHSNPVILRNLACLLLEQKRPEEALDKLQAAIKSIPYHYHNYYLYPYYIGIAHAAMGHTKEALESLNSARIYSVDKPLHQNKIDLAIKAVESAPDKIYIDPNIERSPNPAVAISTKDATIQIDPTLKISEEIIGLISGNRPKPERWTYCPTAC